MQIFNDKKKRVGTLTGFKDRAITKTLDSGDRELTFDYPAKGKLVDELIEERYIRTKTDEYVLKAIEKGDEWNKYTATLNVEELEGQCFAYGFESQEQTIRACLEFAFEGSGWTVGTCTVTKKRTINIEEATTAWSILQNCLKTYRCECEIDSLNKRVNIYEKIGRDRGGYLVEGLNLRKLTANSDTYEFYTRIIPLGKDGITIEVLNDGKDYLENYQYSTKVKTYTWKDERYTNTTSLKEDAAAKLDEMSKPYKVFSADVIDLAKASEEYKNVLDYDIGDTVFMVSKSKRTREKQRIVKIVQYPETPEKNTVELSNTTKTFAEVQKEETDFAKEDAVSISKATTKKILLDYSTTSDVESKITASREQIEAGVTTKFKSYYTKDETDSHITIARESIEAGVKEVEESTMHDYVVKGDFANNGLDSESWYNSNETNITAETVAGLGQVVRMSKTSLTTPYIRQTMGKIPAGKYRIRIKVAVAAGQAGYVQAGITGNTSAIYKYVSKSDGFMTIESDFTVTSESTRYLYLYASSQGTTYYIKSVELLGQYSLYAEAKVKVTTDAITTEVNKKLNSDEFSTKLQQSAYDIRIAFNKSSYMQFQSGSIEMYEGQITDNQKRTRFDYNGQHFYRDGSYIGKIGTNIMKGNSSQRGLVFDIESSTAYMTWSHEENEDDTSYTMKWSYCAQQCGNYAAGMLHAGADIDMHWNKLRNVSWEDGGINGTMNFVQVLGVNSDGTLSSWANGCTMKFKNGILVGATFNG